ncbi:MAG: hypothetical protein KAJ01_05850, partial [Candidatus Hydrogenedentes bacterium]|nr:hypothetical protein [Candidatus Hydrogenedentota bacterium]
NGGMNMRQNLAKSQAEARKGAGLRRRGVLLVFSLVIVATIVSVMLWQQLPEVVVKARLWTTDASRTHHAYAVAAMDIEVVLQVTPEYRMMFRYGCDSPQYRILYRKARLKVAAAAQRVGREMGYSAVLCSPSSHLPDITGRVAVTLVNPSPDFCPVADLSGRPFTGDVISVRV